ncbi:hypothetical protein MPSEU_000462900 [Mayamaea pseudoterrestris]|nr:hypothetical protein MPSEU_000462900 [Mayamaea pseudoterrestris]
MASAPGLTTKKRPVPQWKEAFAGGVAGAFSKTALAPVERVKLLKQLQGSVKLGPLASTSHSSAWQVAANVYRQEGLLAFWRGNLPNVLRTAGSAAINFTCMDYYKKVAVAPYFEKLLLSSSSSTTTSSPSTLQKRQRQSQFITSIVSGGLAGASSTTLLYPFEFLRTRLAMDVGALEQRKYVGMKQVVSSILRSDGIRGFFQGYGVALAGGVVYRILFLGGYDAIKDEVLYRKQQRELRSSDAIAGNGFSSPSSVQLTWSERMVIAQSISLTAGTLCYPFDSVRRRMMMQAGQATTERSYASSVDCMRQVLRKEGVRGFYLGIGPNLVRSVSGALLLVGYDAVRSLLRY